MNKKGFISTTLVYTFLILFLFLMLGIMHAYSEKNKFLDVIDNKIDLRLSTPTTYGKTVLEAILNKYQAEGSKNIDYSKNSDGYYYTDSNLYQDMNAITNGLYYTQIYNDEEGNKVHMTNDDRIIYFFRGNTEQNYVEFANLCWKVYRTNEDESARLVLYGKYNTDGCAIDTSILPLTAYNTNADDNRYIGYMYGNSSSSYDVTHNNINDSKIKVSLDTWYQENLLNTQYEKYLSDQIFCNERKASASKIFNEITYDSNATQTNNTLYESFKRNATGGNSGTTLSSKNSTPSYKCTLENDRFTKTSTLGNKKLNYPIGTLTADEIIISGTTFETSNSSYFLNYGLDKSIWTMTPGTFTSPFAYGITMTNAGKLMLTEVNTENYVLPVISLKSNAVISSGEGTKELPYRIKVD